MFDLSVPDPNEAIYVEVGRKTNGVTLLMKLVLLIGKLDGVLDLIIDLLKNDPGSINKMYKAVSLVWYPFPNITAHL